MKHLFYLLFFTILQLTAISQSIKVACVGNSVTFGETIENRELNSYPSQLQNMLGVKYEVKNFGRSGATLLSKGHRPYINQPEYKNAIDFAADIIVIHLGLNDSDPRNWPDYQDEFVKDYVSLINSFREANSKCKIWICRTTPVFHWNFRYAGTVRYWESQIQRAIEEVAQCAKTGLIDLNEPLHSRPDLFADAVHPNAEGAYIIAKTVYGTLSGDWGGLKMPLLYSNNMILQRDKKLRIAGIANAGDNIDVCIANKHYKTIVNDNGKWHVYTDPLTTGQTYSLTIKTKDKTLEYKNVLAGDVWLCSGQSNMEFQLSSDKNGKEALETCTNNNIRFFNMQPNQTTYAVEWDTVSLNDVNRLKYYKHSNWQPCNSVTAKEFSAIGYYFGKMLSDSLNVPIGLINNAVGGSNTESWIERSVLAKEFTDIMYNWQQNFMIQEWCRQRASQNIKKSNNKMQRHPFEPCYLYEAGIEPLESYPIKGVIWYQGESNAHNKEVHDILMPMMIKSWRDKWNEQFPFYYVQLSGLNRPGWPVFRDGQRRLLDVIPNSGMAVSSDMGDSTDVHPTRKKEVAERLAYLALNKTYNYNNVTACGPMYKTVEFRDNAAYIYISTTVRICMPQTTTK